MQDFIKMGDANLLAIRDNVRHADIVAKKQDILSDIAQFHNLIPTTVLCVGFSSFLFVDYARPVSVTAISPEAREYLTESGVEFVYIPETELSKYHKKFQLVIAVDEYFTYGENEQSQRDAIAKICNLADSCMITTLRDYKNQDYRDREFSQPAVARTADTATVFLQNHSWDTADRSAWSTMIYAIGQTTNSLQSFGAFARRTMYFKQLAKFSTDAGAGGFSVHKNLMYKGLTSKGYEHVITIKFD
jgi:hypothetical protein